MRVAIVGSDAAARLALVTAFDAAPPTWSLSLHREPPADADVIVCDPGAAIPGAIVFDGDDPVDLMGRVAAAARRSKTIVVTSPSGGTGATSVALHLAAELAARDLDTCLVDLDPVWGLRPRLGLEAVEDPPAAPVPVAAGFKLLCGTASLDDAPSDRVVVDAPAAVLTHVLDTDQVIVLLAAPTPEGARRARILLEAHPGLEWRVVTNRQGPGGEMTRLQFERAVARPVLELPCCAALRDSEDDDRLVARGWSRWSRKIAHLVSLIEGD